MENLRKALLRLKPSLFQLIVVLVTSSLIVSCNPHPTETQVDGNNSTAKASKDCDSSSGSSTSRRVYPATRSGGSSSGTEGSQGEAASSDSSEGKTGGTSHPASEGRGGFGTFGRSSSGG